MAITTVLPKKWQNFKMNMNDHGLCGSIYLKMLVMFAFLVLLPKNSKMLMDADPAAYIFGIQAAAFSLFSPIVLSSSASFTCPP